MQEGTAGSNWPNVSEEGETFKLPVLAEHVALGRLGRIYKALDMKTGRMLAVECIDVIDDESKAGTSEAPIEIVRQALKTELERFNEIANEEMRHVFYYDSVSYSQSHVYLRSSFSVINNLAGYEDGYGVFLDNTSATNHIVAVSKKASNDCIP
ncbi:hypothetical protein DVH05_013459 [Phytophthora capsici]|nr:hypothetical protein DVH05_013459 [Phytophthora capsici]